MIEPADVTLTAVTKRYGSFVAVDAINLTIPQGTYCCLLGPSGCGKTTTLRMIAGHERVSDGEIMLGRQTVNDLPPARRRTAMMFQNYALFPHLKCLDNVAFSLKVRGVGKAERRQQAYDMLRLVQMEAFAERLPSQLSGGQQQRVAIGGSAVRGVPMVWAQNIKNVTLRQFGTGVSNINEISRQAKEDLGFTLTMTALDSDAVVQRAVTQPKSYDIADIEYWMAKKVVPTGVLLPLDTQRIKSFDKIVPVFITGKLTPEAKVAQGTAPHTVEFVTGADSAQLAAEPTRWATLIPTIYNADTLGIRPDLVKRPIDTWAELLNPEFKGRASILNIPSIGIMDAAMVCESVGAITYRDKGNMTKDELDKTMKVLTDAKKTGQFRAFWKTFDESVNLMASGEVVIQSMWSPAVTAVRAKGIPCYYTPLKEGYRAWAGGLGVAKHLTGLELDAAYEYINWYLSGWVGAFLNRQGYYSAVLDTAKQHMTEDEWGYWMEGKPAKGDIVDRFGIKIESAGAVRDGGSFYERMGRVTCWNSVMDENRYLIQKWNEFVAA